MRLAGALLADHPGCLLHTHLSESAAEIDLVKRLFPWSKDYTDVYARFGLVGETSIFAHGIHLSERECRALHDAGSMVVLCPTSNAFLGSGLFDIEHLYAAPRPVRVRHRHRYRRRHQLLPAPDSRRGVQDRAAEGLRLQRLRRILPRHPGQCAGPWPGCRDRHPRCRTLGRCRRPRSRGDAGDGRPPGAFGEPGGHAVRADDAGRRPRRAERST